MRKKAISVMAAAALVFTMFFFPGMQANASVNSAPQAPTDLRVNLMNQPLGISNSGPSFSWADHDADSNERQSAYQILIATSLDKLGQNIGDVMDTGKVATNASSYVKISSLSLSDDSLYYWKVRIWDKHDAAGAYSQPQEMTTASDWSGGTSPVWVGTQDAYTAAGWSDYTLEMDLNVTSVAAGVCFRETGGNKNLYMWQFKFTTDAGNNVHLFLNPHICHNGSFKQLDSVDITSRAKGTGGSSLTTGTYFHVKITAKGNSVATYINNAQVDQRDVGGYTDAGNVPTVFNEGVVGLRTGSTEAFLVKNMNIYKTNDSGNPVKTLYRDNFAGGANDFTGGSVSNGAISVGKSTNIYLNTVKAQTGDFAFLRNEFSIPDIGKIDKAIVSVTASSPQASRQYVYNLFLNGSFVGMGPARAEDAANELQYNTFDVTKYLKNGANAIGALNYATSGKQFLLQMKVFYKDGTSAVLLNSGRDKSGWKALDGTSVFGESNSLGTGYYTQAAENINANLYPFGWDQPGFDDSAWTAPVSAAALTASLVPATVENEGRYPFSVAKVVDKGNGDYFIDLGKEIVGGIQLTVNSPVSQQITIHSGEQLSGANTVKWQMLTGNNYEEKWTLRPGQQTIQNYGMKTFRYVEITNCPVALTAGSIKAVAYRQAFDDGESSFTSSDATLNSIYDMVKYTVEATSQDLYVDSQSRERGPYEGDALINMLSSYAIQSSYALPRYSMEYLHYNRTWPAEYKLMSVMMAWNDYLYTGNKDSLTKFYTLLKTNKLDDNLFDSRYNLIKWATSSGSGTDAILVDWPSAERDGYDMTDSAYNTVFNSFAYAAYVDISKIASVLGQSSDSVFYANRASALKTAMIQYLYDPSKGVFRDGLDTSGSPVNHYAQQASAFPLALGVVDDTGAQQSIARSIGSSGLKSSIYSAFFVLQGLYNANAGDAAMSILTSTQQRSWEHVINDLGATISPEAWDPSLKSNMTFSHPWGSAPASQITSGMFGIQPLTPGYGSFQIRFQPGGVKSASIKTPTVKGSIGASYTTTDGRYIIDTTETVPDNTTAVVDIPASGVNYDTLLVDGTAVEATRQGDYLEVELGSGTHEVALPQTVSVALSLDSATPNYIGQSKPLGLSITDVNGASVPQSQADITYTSTAASVASVDRNGRVSFKGAGTCTITATAKFATLMLNGQPIHNVVKTASVTVNVVNPKITGIAVKPGFQEIHPSGTGTVQMVGTLESGDSYVFHNVRYRSSDTSVATVDAAGKVTALKKGSATVTATTEDAMDNVADAFSLSNYLFSSLYKNDFADGNHTFPGLAMQGNSLLVNKGQSANYTGAGSSDWTDYEFDANFTIQSAAASFRLRAQDDSHYYLWQFRADNNTLKKHVFDPSLSGGYAVIGTTNLTSLNASGPNQLRVLLTGNRIATYLNGQLADITDVSSYSRGTFGVRNGGSEAFLLSSVQVSEPSLTAAVQLNVTDAPAGGGGGSGVQNPAGGGQNQPGGNISGSGSKTGGSYPLIPYLILAASAAAGMLLIAWRKRFSAKKP